MNRNRIKQLDLLGGTGAGLLGAGIALLLAEWLRPFALPALLIGIVVHGWAMFEKSRVERDAGLEQPAWSIITRQICWAMLLGLLLYVALKILSAV